MLSPISEESRMEQALRESEAKFRALFDLANDAIFMLLDGIFVDCNARGQKMYGRTREQILGRMPDAFSPPFQPDGKSSQEEMLAIFEKVLEGEAQYFEWLIGRPDGTLRYTEVSLNRLELAGKVYIQAIVRDITERKRAEEQRIRALALLRATLDSTADGILTIGAERQILASNEVFLKMWGIPEEILATKDDTSALQFVLDQLVSPQAFLAKVHYLYENPLEESFDVLDFKDGRIIERFSRPMLVDGRSLGRVWSFRDVTARKQAEERIAEQAELLDQARDAIVVRDFSGAVSFWNKGAERIYGWTRDEAVGGRIDHLIYPDPKKLEALNELLMNQDEWSGELQLLTKDRRELTMEARWTQVRDREGKPKSVLAINTDITEKKKIEAQFMRAQRMESVGTLAGGIAHDLNNILAPIMMSIEVLKRTATDPQAKKIIDSIAVSSKRGADIVRQVLSFARGVDGERTEVRPGDFLKDIENFVKDTFPKNIRLDIHCPGDCWSVVGDPTQLHQILLNLCLNARDAMPSGGALVLTVENTVLDRPLSALHFQAKPGRYVTITLADTGTGIPATIADKIFEPFFTTKEVGKGTGLGLSTVLAIVKSHDGFMNVTSNPDEGTTFEVSLPAMERTTRAAGLDSVPLPSLPQGRGETILIVDDEASVLTVASETLASFGYKTMLANDGAEAVALYRLYRDRIAAVLTDMAMPIMDGPATIRALRELNPAIKIMVASGSASDATMAREFNAQNKYFLSKPYTASTLLRMLRTTLDEPVAVNCSGGL